MTVDPRITPVCNIAANSGTVTKLISVGTRTPSRRIHPGDVGRTSETVMRSERDVITLVCFLRRCSQRC